MMKHATLSLLDLKEVRQEKKLDLRPYLENPQKREQEEEGGAREAEEQS